MLRTRYILLAGLMAAFVAVTANAQVNVQQTQVETSNSTQYSGFGIGGHYSWVRNQETEESTNMFGAMARLRGPVIGVEGSIDYRKDDLGGDIDLKSWPIQASLMVYPIPQIYGLAGLGWYNTTLDFPDGSLFEDQTDTQLGYHVGAGVEVPMATSVALTGDFRYEFVDYEFEDIPESIGNKADALSLRGGLLFYLR